MNTAKIETLYEDLLCCWNRRDARGMALLLALSAVARILAGALGWLKANSNSGPRPSPSG
jgi:hypothetical protein